MKNRRSLKWLFIGTLVSVCFYSLPQGYASSILIWPIDPVIEDDQNSASLWLENKDDKPVYMQIRVFEWKQSDNDNQYTKQTDIAVSPPFALIEPGKRQLIRLIKNIKVQPNQERAYRIIVDEAPRAKKPDEITESSPASVGINFQMRYSVPLFVSGQGIWTNPDYSKNRDIQKATAPKLSYRVINQNNRRLLEVKNDGVVHARLSHITNASGSGEKVLVEGLLGYVLAHSSMTLQLPTNQINGSEKLQALINNNPTPVVLEKR
ncbi:fimbrial biogenesis chaperone [Budvicia aquatica]|uniref:Molecular chaperone n=1 Tax=Budvicia aquatica TaxID=82979 RepID=A0A2C6DR36_9GAMM|nr:molecular chaperone [Budvicia aquatica]PHI31667.1 molecular chaperone [Budvicia aquatica]VFS52380.1 putative fimbrial chaperone protein [Budvicia aquatica]